jgi:hypothetical protein
MAALSIDSTEITVATLWWSECLGGRVKSSVGDDQADMMLDLSRAVSRAGKPTAEQVELFEIKLMDLICKAVVDSSRNEVCLSVDYEPEGLLRTALIGAGITNAQAQLPVKTVMWIKPGGVEVKTGYGADYKRIC